MVFFIIIYISIFKTTRRNPTVFCRMSEKLFLILLVLVGPEISKQGANNRKSITAEKRLSILGSGRDVTYTNEQVQLNDSLQWTIRTCLPISNNIVRSFIERHLTRKQYICSPNERICSNLTHIFSNLIVELESRWIEADSIGVKMKIDYERRNTGPTGYLMNLIHTDSD